MKIRIGLALTMAVVCSVLALVRSADAQKPLVEQSDFTVVNELMVHCGDFDIIANGAGSAKLTTFFDKNGDPIRVAFQGRYNGTMTNSVTGYSIADAPSVANIFIDLIKGTRTEIGAFFTVTVPGDGAVLIQAGRISFDGDGPPTFIAGPHLPPPDTYAVLCSALG